ncbi:MAG: trypsin-like peptidase domain-containing protein [Deltaproteobacteria bacterium]|nr:trypsin-like peptidase domain-containing protein [Deltaproteobacteria bacterium]
MARRRFFSPSLCALALFLLVPSWARGSYLTEPKQLAAKGAKFTWEEAGSKSLKILVQYKDKDGKWKRANLGSGFLISPNGLFVTAYHVMKYCLKNRQREYGFSVSVDCSTEHPALQYRAQNGGREFEIELISHLTREDSTKGDIQTPDEIIKLRDFVIGRLKSPPGVRFPYWELTEFKKGSVDLAHPRADFELKPLVPPKRVFIAGYPRNSDFSIAHGFLNLADEHHRGYFAADIPVYASNYLEARGIPANTKWGIGVENNMSGGPVIDLSGSVIGVVVNGDARTAGILSLENFLETFFSRSAKPGVQPAVVLTPTKTPLYLRNGRDSDERR